MSEMQLPIDLIPGTTPPRFRWRRKVDTVVGVVDVEHEGCMPSSVEDSVVKLLDMTKKLAKDNDELRRSAGQLPPKRELPVSNEEETAPLPTSAAAPKPKKR